MDNLFSQLLILRDKQLQQKVCHKVKPFENSLIAGFKFVTSNHTRTIYGKGIKRVSHNHLTNTWHSYIVPSILTLY